MKVLYIECNMGAAGDMLMSALSELVDGDKFIEKINSLNIPNVTVVKNRSEKKGISGTHIDVYIKGETEENIHHHHHHTGMNKIEDIVNHLDLSQRVKSDVINVYKIIAQAESYVHNKPVKDIHFHEVGTMDAVTDIVGVCMLMEEIGADKIVVSPINVGKGQVKCAHGILPVPAPATAYILKDISIYSNNIIGELCTPTGAALLKYFADEFSDMPVMTVDKIGYGMGSKDFEAVNCVRAIVGRDNVRDNDVTELVCNIDDMTGEEVGFACEMIRKTGALEVFATPVYMKKNRTGILLSCICKAEDKEDIIKSIFKYTSTIGIREYVCKRYVLNREEKVINTDFGSVRAKFSSGYGVEKCKFEYDDLAEIAEKRGISIGEVKDILNKV